MSEQPSVQRDQTPSGPRYRAARRKGWRRFVSFKAFLLYFLGLVLLGVGAVAFAFATIDVPEPNDFSTSESSIIYYDDGETELGRFGAENREIVNSEDIPESLKQAVVAAEDRSFYENPGFDPTGIARAAWDQLRGSASAGGGSTITQQYVKNYYLTQDQTWSRKLNELVIAVKIDQSVDKDQILTDYLNTIWFGRGTYGAQTASRAYFDTDIGELNLAQSAALAAILNSPARYDPTLGDENARRFEERFRYVLDGMVATGAIDQQTADQTEPPEVLPERRENRFGGPEGYLLQMARAELRDLGFEDAQIESGGLEVTTSFNRQAQRAATRAVNEERPTENADGVHVGLAAVRPGDGAVVAVYGGPDAVEQDFNDAVDAKLQPGSTVKPFTLAVGLEEGYSLYSRFAGYSPYEAEGLGPPVTNQGDVSYGWSVDMLQATERSINTAYVDLARNINSATVVDALVRAGIPEDTPGLEANPRVTLGIASVSALDLAEAYATLAGQGRHADAYTISEVRDSSGEVLYEQEAETRRVFEEDVMADVTYALNQVVDSYNGTGTAAQELERPAAAKTGTHEESTSWFAGYTPQLAASVLYFRGDGTESLVDVGGPGPFPGGGYPARTWTAFMRAALEGQPVEEFPEPAYVNAYTQAGSSGPGSYGGEDSYDEPSDDDTGEEETTDEPTDDGGDESGDEGGDTGEESGDTGGDDGTGEETGDTGGESGETGSDDGTGEDGGTGDNGGTGDQGGGADDGDDSGDTGDDTGDTGGTDDGDTGGEWNDDTGGQDGTDAGTESGGADGTESGDSTSSTSTLSSLPPASEPVIVSGSLLVPLVIVGALRSRSRHPNAHSTHGHISRATNDHVW